MNVYLLQIINGIGVGMLYFLLAVGLSIVFGLLRFVNFAHGAFYLLGAYLCYQALQWSANFWAALAVVPLVVGAFAWIVEKLVLRHVYAQPHEFHILARSAWRWCCRCAILAWGPLGDNVPPPDALSGVVMWGGFVYPKYRLFVIGFTAVLAALLWWVLDGTRLGSTVRAGSESSEMVSLLGINVTRVFSLVFALGAATAALAGVLAAPIRGVDPFMGIEALGVAFVVVVVGGMGSFSARWWAGCSSASCRA
jgi:branched-chain amino acid transport system permease protein